MRPRLSSCALAVAPMRAQPSEDAEQVTQALLGERLEQRQRQGEWVYVLTAYDYGGWILADALGPPPSKPWLPARRAGDPVAEARAYLGAPYEWGGLTEAGIDCSGLVHMAFRRLGRLVPRDADQQEPHGRAVPEGDLEHGDLVTYGDAAAADHIAFWLGGGRILHATGRGGVGRVVEEEEPPDLRGRRRLVVRF